eukprot:1177585-Prorocentrum_minimum.AAC.3
MRPSSRSCCEASNGSDGCLVVPLAGYRASLSTSTFVYFAARVILAMCLLRKRRARCAGLSRPGGSRGSRGGSRGGLAGV